MRYEVIAAISLIVSRVTEKDTWQGTRSKLLWGGDGDAGITMTTKNMKTVIGWMRTKNKMVWRIIPMWTARTKVDEESGCGESHRARTEVACEHETIGCEHSH